MDDIKALKEALEAGPTPGEWKLCEEPPNIMWLAGRSIGAADPRDARRVCDAFSLDTPPEPGSMHEANARYIAACSPARIARLLERLEKAERGAERYRWLREQHWHDGALAVVLNPRCAVKLGYQCPSGSLLDERIDAAMAQEKQA